MGITQSPLKYLQQGNKEDIIIEYVQRKVSTLKREQILEVIQVLKQKEFTLEECLGAGTSGLVISAIDEQGCNVAIKIMMALTADQLASCNREADNFNKVKSKYVLSCRQHFVYKQFFFLVTDLCLGGSLSKYTKENSHYNEKQIKRVFAQILQGIIHLHSSDIVHSDIKPANILICENGDIKICDLGLAKVLKQGTNTTEANGATYHYCSWEQFNGQLRKESDYFSAGAILFEICNPMWVMKLGEMKFTLDKIKPELSQFPELTEIALSMMKYEPSERATPRQILDKLYPPKVNPQENVSPSKIGENPEMNSSIITFTECNHDIDVFFKRFDEEINKKLKKMKQECTEQFDGFKKDFLRM